MLGNGKQLSKVCVQSFSILQSTPLLGKAALCHYGSQVLPFPEKDSMKVSKFTQVKTHLHLHISFS